MQKEEDDTDEDREDVYVQQHLFPVDFLFLTEQELAMAPEEDELDRHEGTAVDDVLLSEKHLHQRDDEDAGVRIDAARLLDGVQVQQLPQWDRDDEKQDMNCNRGHAGQRESLLHLRRRLHLEGVDDDTGHDEIDEHDRQRFTVGGL